MSKYCKVKNIDYEIFKQAYFSIPSTTIKLDENDLVKDQKSIEYKVFKDFNLEKLDQKLLTASRSLNGKIKVKPNNNFLKSRSKAEPYKDMFNYKLNRPTFDANQGESLLNEYLKRFQTELERG